MVTDLERLVVQLSADIKKYENAMKRAQGVTAQQTRSIERTWTKSNQRVTAGFGRMGKALGVAFAGAVTAKGAQQLLDSSTKIQNALKVTGLEGDALKKVYDRLFESAQRNAAPIQSLVELYSRASLVQKELGVSTEQLLGFTDKIALALRVQGTDATAASGALLQLSQALGSGTVRAEEFNSIQEGAVTILQAVAAGMQEAGGSVAKLRNLVIEGKISSEAFFRAFEAGSVILENKVANSQLTIAQSFTKLSNSLIDVAGEFNTATGAGAAFSDVIGGIADAINAFDMSGFISEIQRGYGALQTFMTSVGNSKIFDDLVGALGVLDPENLKRYGMSPGASPIIQQRIDDAFSPAAGGKTDRLPQVASPIKASDYAPAAKAKTGRSAREKEFSRETRQIRERTAALEAETAAQASLNPLINDYGFALEKASATQELLNAAKEQGLAITPELKATIDELATGYANASVAAEMLAERQDRIREAAEEFADLGKDVMSGFVNDIRNGVSATEALSNALNKVVDKLLEIAISSLFNPTGGILSSLFHEGGKVGEGGKTRRVHPATFLGAPRMHSGGVAGLRAGEVPAILERGEIVLPKGASKGQGGVTTVDVRAYVDENGNWQAKVERISQSTTAKGLASYDSAKQRQSMTRG